MNLDIILFKILGLFPKVFAILIGAIFSLILSGDIDENGKVLLTPNVLIKFTFSISTALYGGEAFIEYYSLQEHSVMYQGAIMMLFAVFGMLIIGLIYQSIALMQGKSISEIVQELKSAFLTIFKDK